ncbi:putative 2-(5''-triphosphoribosyl)-3'-dephosphocoenzyme-A synthase [Thiomonas sp. X19]|nr:putative 2-(5''-triphosphoribosyl)-3'-dephosphocoenzyme-A synthase [Thiomonas sp. X19]
MDRRGSGAHHDLDLARMLRSAEALRLPLTQMAQAARGARPSSALRTQLASIGRSAEQRMLMATGGANAHRGAIWALGLLVAAASLHGEQEVDAELLASTAAAIARHPDQNAVDTDSHGVRICRRYGVGGAKAEACDGFPHALQIGLPCLRQARARGCGEQHARLDALLAIMSRLADTCLLHRGGPAALDTARRGAQSVLDLGGSSAAQGMQALMRLDHELLALHASPGGSADLLAVTLFLDGTDVLADPCLMQPRSDHGNARL